MVQCLLVQICPIDRCLQTKAADFTLKLLECMVVTVCEKLSCENYWKSYLHLHVCPIDIVGVCYQLALLPVGHTLITYICLQTKAADFTLKLLECMVVRVCERLSCEKYSKSY